MFKKKENGFSLVELAVAAAIATALAVVAVSVVTGTATSVSEKGSSAAAAEECTISESLKGGTDETINDCGTASSGGATQSGPYTIPTNQFYAGVTTTNTYNAASSYWSYDSGGYYIMQGLDSAYALELQNIIENSSTITVDGNTYNLSVNTLADPGKQYTAISSYWYGGSQLQIFISEASTLTPLSSITTYYVPVGDFPTYMWPTITFE